MCGSGLRVLARPLIELTQCFWRAGAILPAFAGLDGIEDNCLDGTLITADSGMADVLASVPDNTMPVTQIGHGLDSEYPGALAHPAEWFR